MSSGYRDAVIGAIIWVGGVFLFGALMPWFPLSFVSILPLIVGGRLFSRGMRGIGSKNPEAIQRLARIDRYQKQEDKIRELYKNLSSE